jgi:hypothetical protein
MKILSIHFNHLRNEAHYQFLLLLQKLFGTYPAVAAIVAGIIAEFNSLLATEGQLVDAVRSSEYTVELKESDERVDRCVVGINSTIKAGLHHFDSTVVAAARKLETVMKAFRGNIESKAYEEESAAVKILITDFQTTYAPQVEKLGLGPWLTELIAAQADFERIFLLRSDQRANKPQEHLKDVRKEIDGVYKKMIEKIDAYTIMNGETDTIAFVKHLNDEITYFNEHSHRHAKKDIGKAVVESIPDQLFEDEPVIVLPDVSYEEQKLVFTKDYELSFHENDRPGTASISIHGKGAFKGQKTVSFNIKKAHI